MKGIIQSISAIIALGMSILSNAATIQVTQVGLTFDPAEITITAGDTVEWIWADGTHTVTNGTGHSDPDAGTLFDMPLDSGSSLVDYTFDQTGDFDYHCHPHVAAGMVGIVHVVAPPPFVKIGTVEATPQADQCNDPVHYGRMIVDSANDALYFCSVNGWQSP